MATGAERVAEGLVKVAIAELRSEILPQLAEIKERIIGIDGNGTGREGAIQVLQKKMDRIGGNVDLLLTRDAETKGALKERQKDTDTRWWKQPLAIGLIVAVVELASKFLEHTKGW